MPQMKDRCQLHGPAALAPEKEPAASNGEEAGWKDITWETLASMDNIKSILRETVCEDVDWIQRVRDWYNGRFL
jgi:hypothetical protein